jgi:hypothetical protein
VKTLLRAALVVVIAVVAFGVTDRPSDAAPPIALVVLRGDGAVLTFQADAGAIDAGRFAFTAPGLGTYLPARPAEVRRQDEGQVHANYAGPADRYATMDGAPIAAALRLELELRVAGPRPIGEAEVRVADSEFHVRLVQIPPELPNAVLRPFESATRSADWNGLYSLLSSDLATSVTTAAFVADATSQARSLGAITGLRRVAVGSVRTSPQGVVYATVRYELTRAGKSTPSLYDADFVFEETGWKLWFTAAP